MPISQLLPPSFPMWSNDVPLKMSLARALSDRTRAIVHQAGCWSDGLDGSVAALGPLTEARYYHLGAFALPPIGNTTDTISVYFKIEQFSASGISFGAVFDTDQSNLGKDLLTAQLLFDNLATTLTPSGDGWIGPISLVHPGDRFEARLTIVAKGTGTPSMKLTSVCAATAIRDDYDDGQTIPADWPAMSLEWLTSDSRPADAHLFETLIQQQSHVIDRRPRMLFTHAFQDPRSSFTTTLVPVTYSYRVRRGPLAGPVTFRIYAKIDNASGPGAISAKVNGADVDLYVSGSPESDVEVSSTTGAWHEFEIRDEWVANDLNDIEITCVGGFYLVSDVTHFTFVTTLDIIATENAVDPTDFVITDGDRNEPIPTRLFPAWPTLPTQSHFEPRWNNGQIPVVGSYRRGDVQDQWTDLYSLAQDVLFQGINRTQLLIFDHLDRDLSDVDLPSYGYNATTVSIPSSTTLSRIRWQPSLGTGSLRVVALFRFRGTFPTDGAAYGGGGTLTVSPSADIPVDQDIGEFGASNVLDYPRAPFRHQWVVTLPHPTNPIDLAIAANVFKFGSVTGLPTTQTDFAIELSSVSIEEIPLPTQPKFPSATMYMDTYFYELDAPPGGLSIGPGSNDGGSITVPTGREFDVRHVSLKLVVTGITDPSKLAVTLQSPDGDEPINVKLTAGSLPNGWYSDDEIGDATPEDAMTGLLPSTSVGDWTLTVYNNDDTETAVVHEFGLELR